MNQPESYELPDDLPSRFKNWMELYCFMLNSSNLDLTTTKEVNLFEYMTAEDQLILGAGSYWNRKYKVVDLKSRALDFILSSLPHPEELMRMRYSFKNNSKDQRDAEDVYNKVFEISYSAEVGK